MLRLIFVFFGLNCSRSIGKCWDSSLSNPNPLFEWPLPNRYPKKTENVIEFHHVRVVLEVFGDAELIS